MLHLSSPPYYTIKVKTQNQLQGPKDTDYSCEGTTHTGLGSGRDQFII